MGWQLSQRALVYSIWITQPPLSKSKLEVTWQATLFLLSCTPVTGQNWFELVTTEIRHIQVWNVESTYLHLYLLHIEVIYNKMIISMSRFQIQPWFYQTMKHMCTNDIYSHEIFLTTTEQRLTFKSEKSVTYLTMQLLIV